MSNHEANSIKRQIQPFLNLLILVTSAMMLASCGRSGSQNTSVDMRSQVQNELSSSRVTPDESIKTENGYAYEGGVISLKLKNTTSIHDFEVQLIQNQFSVKSDKAPYYHIRVNGKSLQELLDISDYAKSSGLVEYAAPNIQGEMQSFNDTGYYDEKGDTIEDNYWNINAIKLKKVFFFNKVSNLVPVYWK